MRDRRIMYAMLAAVMLAVGCERLCAVLERITPVVDRARMALDLALPVLLPAVAMEYAALRTALDAAMGAGTSACRAGGDAERVQAAADAATALLEFYRTHQNVARSAAAGSRAPAPSDAEVDAALLELGRARGRR